MVIAIRERINLFTMLFVLLLVAQVLDVVYTRKFLLIGGQETNPVAGMLIVNSGWWGLLFVKTFPCIMGVIVTLFMKETELWVKALVWFGVAVYIPLTIFHLSNVWVIL